MLTHIKRAIHYGARRAGYEIKKIPPSPLRIGHKNRPFLNIGAGSFRHPDWRNLDFHTENYAADVDGNMDIALDLSECRNFPLESDSMEGVYTSHTIEHIQDRHASKALIEAYRVLKPGGLLRITCPDIEIYYDAYQRGDRDLFMVYGSHYREHDIEQLFLREFATQLSTANNDALISQKKIATEEVRGVFSIMPMTDALDHFTSMVNYADFYRECPGNHVNWWSYQKLFSFLEETGFRRFWRSGYGQSRLHAMRDISLFDSTSPIISLYAEAQK